MPSSYSSATSDGDMILIKREDCGGVATTAGEATPPDFSTVFPDSSTSSGQKSTTMWEDIASSIKKLDPDHADVLLEASTPTSLPPVSTVGGGVSADGYYQQHYNNSFAEQDLFSSQGYLMCGKITEKITESAVCLHRSAVKKELKSKQTADCS